MDIIVTLFSILVLCEVVAGFVQIRKPNASIPLLQKSLIEVERRLLWAAGSFAVICWVSFLKGFNMTLNAQRQTIYIIITGSVAMLAQLLKDFVLHEIQTRRNALGGQ